MPIYKGSTEVASGNLYKGSTEIQDGYKATDSFYVNEISISFLNFPGVSDYVITGVPGDTIPGNRYQQWTVSANSGFAFNGTQTATGLPTDFSFSAGSQGSISNTTTSPRVNYAPSVFPSTSVSVDYNNLTVSLPQTQIVTYSYTFTGNLGRSTSCSTFAGTACSVSSSSSNAGNYQYWQSNASGTGGGGAGGCNQSCGVSISSGGGSSSCNTNGSKLNSSIYASFLGCGQLNVQGVAMASCYSGPACSIPGGTNITVFKNGSLFNNYNTTTTNCNTYDINVVSFGSQAAGNTYVAKSADGTTRGTFVASNPCGNN
tara:strand:+ start:223 stop:1170 length:948 start_codon:yes stop_codon:yes gene_type:complete